MIRSMTGFCRVQKEYADKILTLEIRSVNNRYLDVNLKAPRSYAIAESRLKSYLQANGISRGKVDISLSVERKESATAAIRLDHALASAYIESLRELRDAFGLQDDISVMRVAENREIFLLSKKEEDTELEWQELLPLLDEALLAFRTARENEGAALECDLLSRLATVEQLKNEIVALSAEDKESYRDRLLTRLRQTLSELQLSVDENRILTECAIFSDRVAVDEETVRLDSHFASFRAILAGNEPAGRKLDFLMQEMNRETNTIGSKCANAEIAKRVVDMKCELEKIREQVQNIE